jgi:hypothetical protein
MNEKQLLATLKRYAPVKLIATVGDEQKAVAVPNVRKRWDRVMSTLAKLAWSKLELQDKSGALLYAVENAEPAGELADLPAGRAAELNSLLTIVLRAQAETARWRDSEFQALVRAQADVMREVTASVRALSALHQEQLVAARELGEIEREQVEAAAQNSDQLKQFMEAMPLIMQALPALKSLLGDGAAPAPNGARKAS